MSEVPGYLSCSDEINKDKMHVTITNLYPQYRKQLKKEVKYKITGQLYKIFHKYA